jgi:hypothetical protein
MKNEPTMTDRFAVLKTDTSESLEALRNEKANRGVMITSTPFVIGTAHGSYLVADREPGRYTLGNRGSAVQFSRRDAEAVAAKCAEQVIEAEVLTQIAAIDRDMETLENLLKVIEEVDILKEASQ